MQVIDAYRWGEAEPPEWLVWERRHEGRSSVARSEEGIGGWQKVTSLGEQIYNGELVNIVEAGVWGYYLKPGPGRLPEELALIRGGA